MMQDSRKTLTDFAASRRITWRFITPLSPHQGGFYERLIKQVKSAMKVVVGNQSLSWNEMSTVFAEIKGIINSRPIGYLPDHPDDCVPLTPNHLLLGRATPEVPQGPFKETKDLHKRFLFVQSLTRRFWERFQLEYVPTLQKRSKWLRSSRPLAVDDVVLLVDKDAARGKWELGRVTHAHPGKDGVIRNVTVKTKSGAKDRSVQNVSLLLSEHK